MRHPFLRTLAGSGVTTDPNFENVTLLLHGDETNGGQNNTFVDGSTNNFTITRNGNTTQGTFSPYGDNWSNYFDGTGDYLSTPSNAAFDFGSGDFTIECWVYVNAFPPANSGGRIICRRASAGNKAPFDFWIDPNGAVVFSMSSNGSTWVFDLGFATSAITRSTWTHLAVVRNGSNWAIYVNGISSATQTSSASVMSSSAAITTGALGDGTYALNAYISNLRVLKGTAQYTANFTAPTAPLAAITNTSLLTCQSNRFRDASTNNFTITRNGDVSVQRFSPFSPTAAYAAGTIGGSGYFDGTDDYLTLPTGQTPLLLGSSDWTFEAWVYRLSNTNTAAIFVGQSDLTTVAGSGFVFYVSSSVTSEVYQSTSRRAVTSPNPTIGQWAHVAWARTGGTFSSYLNGSQVGTVGTLGTAAINDGSTTYAPAMGAFANGANDFFGYIAGARLIKGSGGYDATSATITVPTSPPTAITNTSLLLNFTNAAILDNAMMAVPETVGNAQIDTTTKKYGTGSMKFDGTGDWLLIPDSIDQRLGTGNFTIECWLYLSATGTARGIVGKGTSTTGWLLSTNTSNAVVFTYGTSTITSTGTLSGTTWYHIAVVREGTSTNQTKIYIGGTNDGTGTVSTDFNQTNAAYVGANRTGGDPMNGYIDDLRITKGVARYTANFTAPTAAFPDL